MLFTARGAPKARKTTAEIPTVDVLFDDLPDDGAVEAVLVFVALIPEALEFVEVVLDQAIQAGGLRVSGPIDSLEKTFHMESNCPR
jgi:hypothetical protein